MEAISSVEASAEVSSPAEIAPTGPRFIDYSIWNNETEYMTWAKHMMNSYESRWTISKRHKDKTFSEFLSDVCMDDTLEQIQDGLNLCKCCSRHCGGIHGPVNPSCQCSHRHMSRHIDRAIDLKTIGLDAC
jgi:hypothetical protein